MHEKECVVIPIAFGELLSNELDLLGVKLLAADVWPPRRRRVSSFRDVRRIQQDKPNATMREGPWHRTVSRKVDIASYGIVDIMIARHTVDWNAELPQRSVQPFPIPCNCIGIGDYVMDIAPNHVPRQENHIWIETAHIGEHFIE